MMTLIQINGGEYLSTLGRDELKQNSESLIHKAEKRDRLSETKIMDIYLMENTFDSVNRHMTDRRKYFHCLKTRNYYLEFIGYIKIS